MSHDVDCDRWSTYLCLARSAPEPRSQIDAEAMDAVKMDRRIPPTAVGGLFKFDLRSASLTMQNPTHGSGWIFQIPPCSVLVALVISADAPPKFHQPKLGVPASLLPLLSHLSSTFAY